ncbi:MAG: prepilin-type N-terminal cleavage/methylation domain-containing protein, partial [Verrucomicrobiota bacterium]
MKVKLHPRTQLPSKQGFSLVELLTVLVIMATVSSISVFSLRGIMDSSKMRQAIVTTSGVLEQARLLAAAHNTHTYVFFREVSGSGVSEELRLILISSKDGTDVFDPMSGVSDIDYRTTNDQELVALNRSSLKVENIKLKGHTDTHPISISAPSPSDGLNTSVTFTDSRGNVYDRMLMFRPSGEAVGALNQVSNL